MFIKGVEARKIKDSRNEDTIEVSLNGCKASSPAGKSKGKYETPSYHGSLEWNIKFINNLKIDLEISSFNDLVKIENLIKKKAGLKDAKQFGANALFALESAILKALAKSKNHELWHMINPKARKMPVPIGNVLGGGLHSHYANHPVFQEFLLIPKGNSFKENYSIMKSIYQKIKKDFYLHSINDEGALESNLSEEEILNILSKFKKTNIGIDMAASSFYRNGFYYYKNKFLDKKSQISYINSLIKDFKIFYMEDPLNEEDFSGFSKILKKHLIVGDDLTATHITRLLKAIKNHSINAIIIKPNQNGSLLELKKIFDLCKKHKIKTILSHRSGETLDDSLADYAFAFQADFIKTGIATKWREAKLKRLLNIEKSL